MKTGMFAWLAGLLVTGAVASADAQTAFSAKGGLSFGNISHKGVLPGALKTRTGFAAGLALTGGQGLVGLGIEGLYAQRGLKSDESLATSETRLDYIDVPVYLRIAIPIPSFEPFVYAGPQVSFEINCRTAAAGDCDDDPDRSKTMYAGDIGAGIKLGGRISIEGRYIYGLTDLKLSTVTSSESFKHRNFMILIGLGL